MFSGVLLLLHLLAENISETTPRHALSIQRQTPGHTTPRDVHSYSLALPNDALRLLQHPTEENTLEEEPKQAEDNIPNLYLKRERFPRPEIPANADLCAFQYLEEALEKTAVKRLLFLQVIPDQDHVILARNNYDTLKRNSRHSNILFVCTEVAQCEVLAKHNLGCYINRTLPPVTSKSLPGFSTIYNAIKLGYTIIYMSFDVSIVKNPNLDITHTTNVDILVPYKVPLISNSFYIATPSFNSTMFHKAAMDAASSAENMTQQDIFLRTLAMKTLRGEIVVGVMPQCAQPPSDNKCPVTLHPFMATPADRVFWLKENRMWFTDANRYYSNPKGRYLSYANTYDMGKYSILYQIHALKNALAIGEVLNRSVILPQFVCWTCDQDICSSSRCLLSSILDMRHFARTFPGMYREHSFTGHPMVPESVKNNVSEFVINTSLLKLMDYLGGKRTLPQKTAVHQLSPDNLDLGPSSEEILAWFGLCNDPIIHIHHLYGSYSGFTDAAESIRYEHKLKAGIVLKSSITRSSATYRKE